MSYKILSPSPFKILISFLSVAIFIYILFVEKDLLKAMLFLNVIANYRIFLNLLTDWNSEVIYTEPTFGNNIIGISNKRFGNFEKIPLNYTKKNEDAEEEEVINTSNNYVPQQFTNKNDKYEKYENPLYNDFSLYNFDDDSYIEWWRM
jgi:hypothetical protein